MIMFNHGSEPYDVKQGSRIAQLIIYPYCRLVVKEETQLSESIRGCSGFGSSGE